MQFLDDIWKQLTDSFALPLVTKTKLRFLGYYTTTAIWADQDTWNQDDLFIQDGSISCHNTITKQARTFSPEQRVSPCTLVKYNQIGLAITLWHSVTESPVICWLVCLAFLHGKGILCSLLGVTVSYQPQQVLYVHAREHQILTAIC